MFKSSIILPLSILFLLTIIPIIIGKLVKYRNRVNRENIVIVQGEIVINIDDEGRNIII